MKYPKEWDLKIYPQEKDLLLSISFGSKPGEYPVAAFISVRKQIKPLDEYVLSSDSKREWKLTDGDKITIDKQIGYYFKDFPGPTVIDYAYIPFNGLLYELYTFIDRNDPEKNRRVFNQILSTFRFVP